MTEKATFDIIIIGGSYAGLQAAMTLGRALRSVLIIDSSEPCNQQTPHSHNFLTRDGETPAALATIARSQLKQYENVSLFEDKAVYSMPHNDGFEIGTLSGKSFTAKKLLFAAGIKDAMPDLPGFAACWGISVIHCPYCHGYEVHGTPTGILANGDAAFEFAKLINNWTDKLTIFTNGPSTLNHDQRQKLKAKGIEVVENKINEIVHQDGYIRHLLFEDGSQSTITALYARVPFTQHCHIPQQLGCGLNEHGYIKIDGFHRTNIPGVYAAGDCANPLRAVAAAVSGGMMAGAAINKDLIDIEF